MVVKRGCTSTRGRNEKKVCEWEEVVRVRPVWIELFCFSIDYISCSLFSSLGWNATGLFSTNLPVFRSVPILPK